MKIKGRLVKHDNNIYVVTEAGKWSIGNYSEVVACEQIAKNMLNAAGLEGAWTVAHVTLEVDGEDRIAIGNYGLTASGFKRAVEAHIAKKQEEYDDLMKHLKCIGYRLMFTKEKIIEDC